MRTLLLAASLLAACTTPAASSATAPTTTAAPVAVAATPEARHLVASLERGACFGRCPMYVVRAWSDGTVEFEGRRFVATLGTATGTLSAEQLAQVKEAFAAARFETFKAEYADPRTTDMPWHTVSNGVKTVRHYTGDEAAPPALTELENTLDRLLGVTRWTTGPER